MKVSENSSVNQNQNRTTKEHSNEGFGFFLREIADFSPLIWCEILDTIFFQKAGVKSI